jgi:hypothetical protein
MNEKTYAGWDGSLRVEGLTLEDLAADDSQPTCAELARDLLVARAELAAARELVRVWRLAEHCGEPLSDKVDCANELEAALTPPTSDKE